MKRWTPVRYNRGCGPGIPRCQQGIALVMVLWLVVLLTVVAASFTTHTRVETRMTGNLVERHKARMLLQTGLNRALLELMAGNSEQRWQVDGEVHELRQGEDRLLIAIRSATGLVDLNRASRDTLFKLFVLIDESLEVRERLVDALSDWRDADDLKRLNGAEDRDYTHAGFDYGTVDRDLESIDELGYVMGFDRDRVAKLRPYVTVYSGATQIDKNYAAQDLIDLLKSGEDSLGGQLAAAFEQLDSGLVDIDGVEEQHGLGQAQRIGYRISIEATTQGGGQSTVDVDVASSNQRDRPFKILAWHLRY